MAEVITESDLKIIKAYRRDIDIKDYVRRSARDSDYETLIDESCVLVDGDTNEVLAVYKELPFDEKPLIAALDRTRFDVSTRISGLKTTSRIFGYAPRAALRKDFCSSTSMAVEQPREHAEVVKYGVKIAGLYEQYTPETYAKHKDITTSNVLDQYALEHTPFTSGIINKNNPLKYHFDSGNFKSVYSCMAVFKIDVDGGHLSLPEFNVGFKLRHNTVFMFDGQSILHGVTPIKRLSSKANRYSIVYYSLQQIWKCLPLSEELARIRKVKTERESRRAQEMIERGAPAGADHADDDNVH